MTVVIIPDGLKLLFLALFLGDGGEGILRGFDGSGGSRLFPLQRVKLINGLNLHRWSSVILVGLALLFVRLNLRQPVPCGVSKAEFSITVLSHLLLPANKKKSIIVTYSKQSPIKLTTTQQNRLEGREREKGPVNEEGEGNDEGLNERSNKGVKRNGRKRWSDANERGGAVLIKGSVGGNS